MLLCWVWSSDIFICPKKSPGNLGKPLGNLAETFWQSFGNPLETRGKPPFGNLVETRRKTWESFRTPVGNLAETQWKRKETPKSWFPVKTNAIYNIVINVHHNATQIKMPQSFPMHGFPCFGWDNCYISHTGNFGFPLLSHRVSWRFPKGFLNVS